MSSFKCDICGKDILDTPAGYVTGCFHYPVDDLLPICYICKHSEHNICLKGHTFERTNHDSPMIIFGCQDFEIKE